MYEGAGQTQLFSPFHSAKIEKEIEKDLILISLINSLIDGIKIIL